MTRIRLRTIVIAASFVLVATTLAQESDERAAAVETAVRFASVDIFLDSSVPVAAWQFELTETHGAMTVVGVENGDSDAFDDAPYFDLDAVANGAADRIVVADFSLMEPDLLPVGSTRIATIHVRLRGSVEPDYALRLIAAGDAEGVPIDATVNVRLR